MDYRTVPGQWKVGPNVYPKGSVVSGEMLARYGPVSSYLRLGLIEPVDAPDKPWWDGLTKSEILNQATVRGIDLDAGLTKKKLIQLLEEAPDGV